MAHYDVINISIMTSCRYTIFTKTPAEKTAWLKAFVKEREDFEQNQLDGVHMTTEGGTEKRRSYFV